MTRHSIVAACAKLGLTCSEEAWQRLESHVQLLEKWQPTINLIGKSTLADIWGRHVLDSLQLLPMLPPDARTLIDLGSGAGFPGLVVAAVRPDITVRLVEADQRKSVFLGEAVRGAAPNAIVITARIEAVPAQPADIVTARALAPLPKLLAWAHKFVTDPAICLFHKGEGLDNELTDARRDWMMDVDRVPSVTAPGAAILRVARLRPRR
jgi:16S rRNA (guanine527-N7)-methyltransferase